MATRPLPTPVETSSGLRQQLHYRLPERPVHVDRYGTSGPQAGGSSAAPSSSRVTGCFFPSSESRGKNAFSFMTPSALRPARRKRGRCDRIVAGVLRPAAISSAPPLLHVLGDVVVIEDRQHAHDAVAIENDKSNSLILSTKRSRVGRR